MHAGDIVTAINGNPIREQEDLFLQISAALAGTVAEIEVLRNGVPRTIKVRLAKSSHAEPVIASNRPRPVFGVTVDYTSTLSLESNPPEGVLIREIESDTPAEKQLKEWSDRSRLIVVAVDGKPVQTPREFYRLAAGKKTITLDIVEAVRSADSPQKKRITLP